jgi:glycogen operon protein
MARRLIALRRAEPAFRRLSFLEGRAAEPGGLPDAWWFREDGRHLSKADWNDAERRVLGVFLNGDAMPHVDEDGTPIEGGSFLVIVNGSHADAEVRVPARRFGRSWALELSTAAPDEAAGAWTVAPGGSITSPSRSVVVLRRVRSPHVSG